MVTGLLSKRGQAIIEFAFVLPLLCIIVLGLAEYGILFYDKAVITNASREGAKVAMAFETDADGNYWSETDMQAAVQQTVNDYLESRLIAFGPPAAITTTATRTHSSPEYNYYAYQTQTEGTVTVAVSYAHSWVGLPNIWSSEDAIRISAETVMRLE